MGKNVRLGLMMLLQYAVWGAWWPPFSAYLQNTLGYNGNQLGVIYSLLPLATMISPFIIGQLADRYFATQKVIAVLQLSGGVLMIVLSKIVDYHTMIWMLLAYCLCYAPTVALTNSITFHHVSDSEKEFGWIRAGGTIGWMTVGVLLSAWRFAAKRSGAPAYAGDMLLLCGIVSLIYGLYALTLPHTPPSRKAKNPLAFMQAIKMLKNKNYAMFVLITFIVSTELMFYYVLAGPFLLSDKVGVKPEALTGVMAIAQVAEFFIMAFLLPFSLRRFGVRTTLIAGVLAWPLRYIIFAVGSPAWLVIASLTLHGFCFVFFFVVCYIYVDAVSPKDIRASAQSLFVLLTNGLGMYLGSIFAGRVQNMFSQFTADGSIISVNWTGVFLVPCVVTLLCAATLPIFWEEKVGIEDEKNLD